jgi:tetratricopeptide (TPR) repeat protein
MIEKYMAVYILVTLLFAYILSFYLQKRFKGADKEHLALDKRSIQLIENSSWLQRTLARAFLYKNNRLMITLFFFLFNIAIPVIGYPFTLWICWYLVNITYKKSVVFTNILDLDEFKNRFMEVERVFGEGSMLNLINNEYTPKSKKLRALAILASNPSPASLAIIKQTLSSTDDEIRLYGYSILNNLEKKINSRINKNLETIHTMAFKKNNEQNDEAITAQAAVTLAFSYWELVYMELSHESLKNNFLNSAITYIELAKEYYLQAIDQLAQELKKEKKLLANKHLVHKKELELQEHYETASNLFTLMGRIFLYRGMHEQAQAEFTIAKELLPENSTTIVPYLAEVYFNIKKYSVVKSLFSQSDTLRFNTKLYPVVKQWEQKSA